MTEGCFVLPPLLAGGGSALCGTSSNGDGGASLSLAERKCSQGDIPTKGSTSNSSSSTRSETRPRLQLPGCISRSSFYSVPPQGDEALRRPIAATPTGGGSCLSSLFSGSFGFSCCSPSSQSMPMQWGGSPSTASGSSSGRSSRWDGGFEEDVAVGFFPASGTLAPPKKLGDLSDLRHISTSIFSPMLSPHQRAPTTETRPTTCHHASPRGKVFIWSSREENEDAHAFFEAIPKSTKGTKTSLSASRATIVMEPATPSASPSTPSVEPEDNKERKTAWGHPAVSREETDRFESCIWSRTTTPSTLRSTSSLEAGGEECEFGEDPSPAYKIHPITEEASSDKWEGERCPVTPFCAFVEDVSSLFVLIEKLGAGRQGVVYRCQPLSRFPFIHSRTPYHCDYTRSEEANPRLGFPSEPPQDAPADNGVEIERTEVPAQCQSTVALTTRSRLDAAAALLGGCMAQGETSEGELTSPSWSRYNKHELEGEDSDGVGVTAILSQLQQQQRGGGGLTGQSWSLFAGHCPALEEPEEAGVEEFCLKHMVNESLPPTVLERICRLRSPHVIQHYGAIQDRRGQWLIMELARGPELLTLIELKHHQYSHAPRPLSSTRRLRGESDKLPSEGKEESFCQAFETRREVDGGKQESLGVAEAAELCHWGRRGVQDRVPSCLNGEDCDAMATTEEIAVAQRSLNEETCKKYLKEMLQGIAAIHAEGLIHGDVKAENFVLREPFLCRERAPSFSFSHGRRERRQRHRSPSTSNAEDLGGDSRTGGKVPSGDAVEGGGADSRGHATCNLSRLLLADLGTAIPLEVAQSRPKGGMHSYGGGTPMYMAPELFTKAPYDGKVDVWAAGVVFALLLAGRSPFGNADILTHLYRRCADNINKTANTTTTASVDQGKEESGRSAEPEDTLSGGSASQCRGDGVAALCTGASTTCSSVTSTPAKVKAPQHDDAVLKPAETITLAALLSRDFEDPSEMAVFLDPLIDEEIWKSDAWKDVSYEAKGIARKLLTVDPKKRPTAEAALADLCVPPPSATQTAGN